MRFTVLGRYGAVPDKNGALSSYYIEGGGAKILQDCGSGAVSRLWNYCSPEDLDAVILSHLHSDHMNDMLPLRYYFERIKKHITVYLPFTDCPEFTLLSQCAYYDLKPVRENETININGAAVEFFRMKHKIESYASRITADNRTFVYSGDTAINDNITKSIEGAHAYLCDCAVPESLHEPSMPHMSVRQGVEIAKPRKIKLYITHRFIGQDIEDEAAKLYSGAVAVTENTTYEV